MIKEKFSSRKRIYATVVLFLVLLLTLLQPSGIINFDRLSGQDILVAQREGAANCMTTLKLKRNHKFVEKSVCFGVTQVSGTYERRGDTIIFKSIHAGRDVKSYYSYAVIRRITTADEEDVSEIVSYQNLTDTLGRSLTLTKLDKNWHAAVNSQSD